MSDFEQWFGGSKYTQVVYPSAATKQIALDGWNAAIASMQSEEYVSIPTAPKKIWLNIGDTDPQEVAENGWQWSQMSDVTWCEDKIDQCDIPYIRADLAPPPDAAAKIARLTKELEEARAMVDGLLAHCPDAECFTCGEIICPHKEPLHFHHDGCPACAQHEAPISKIGGGE